MNSLRCGNCSLLNFATATACKRCGLPFESAAGTTEWDANPYASSEAYPPPIEGASPYWDQPSYQPPYQPNYLSQPAPSSSSGGKIVAVVVVLAVVALASFLAIPKLLKSKKVEAPNVSWTEYKSPDKKFSISLPVAPKVSLMSQPAGAGSVQVNVLEASVSKDGGCILLYADYPIGQMKMSEETLYDYTLKGLANRGNAFGAGARKYITHDGRKGLEMEFNPTTKNKLEVTANARLFWVSPRIYVLMTGGPDTPEYRAIQAKCQDSFRFLQGS